MSQKKIILRPKDNGDEPPDGLNIAGSFKRLGILNASVVQYGSLVYLLSRLYYSEGEVKKSCIVRNAALLEGDSVRIVRDEKGRPIEELVLAPGPPHGQIAVEDMRVGSIQGEPPLHAFLVHYNGVDARTEYLRTKESEPSNLLKWDRFGIYFPNITLEEAIEIAPNKKYKDAWIKQYAKNKGQRILSRIEQYVKKGKQRILGRQYQEPARQFLNNKDCGLFPRKIKGKYAIPIRLFPDMQIVYVEDFKELSEHEFWQKTIKNLEEHLLLERKYDWEESHICSSYSPFETSEGFVIPYHGAIMEPERDYKFGAVLVDKNNPQKILRRSKKPLLEATEPWESNGIVSGKVVFPTGHAVWDGYYHIFYGAGDEYIAHTAKSEQRFLDNFR